MRRGRGNVTQPHKTEGKRKESRVTTAGRGAFRPGLSPGVVHGGGRQRFEGLLRRAQLDARLLLHGAPAQGRRWQELRQRQPFRLRRDIGRSLKKSLPAEQ